MSDGILRDARAEIQSALDYIRMVINATDSDRLWKEGQVAAKDCVAALARLDAAIGHPLTCPETALRCDSKACLAQGCARTRHEFKPGPGMYPGICAECGYPASEIAQHFPRAALIHP